MPSVRQGESLKSYLSRAIPYLIREGTAKNSSQAAAIAHSLYRKRKHKRMKFSNVPDAVFCLSDGETIATNKPLEFWKEVAHVGQFEKGDFKFAIDEPLLDHWHRTFGKMQKHGLNVPVPVEHTRNPEKRRGTAVEFARRLNSKGIPALFSRIKFRDAEAAKLAHSSNVSLFAPKEIKSGAGKVFKFPIEHVAITDYPVIHDLEPFQPIILSQHIDTVESLALDLHDDKAYTRMSNTVNALTLDADNRAREALALSGFPPAKDDSADKQPQAEAKPNPGQSPQQTNAQTQPGANPKPAAQMTLKDLAQQLGLDPNQDDATLLLQISQAVAAMKARAQAPMPPQGMPPQIMQQRPVVPPVAPPMQHGVVPGQQPMPPNMHPPAMHTGRPPIAMAQRTAAQALLLSEDDVMAMSKKQFKKIKKAIKNGSRDKHAKGDKSAVQKLNSKSHFGGEVDSDQDETYHDEDNDAFANGADNDDDGDETMNGKGKAGKLSRGSIPTESVALSGSVLELVKSARQDKIDHLFASGYLTVPAKNQLVSQYVNGGGVALSHSYDDGFEAALNFIKANGKVLPTGKSGPQALGKAIALSNGEEENPLLADVNRRCRGETNYAN